MRIEPLESRMLLTAITSSGTELQIALDPTEVALAFAPTPTGDVSIIVEGVAVATFAPDAVDRVVIYGNDLNNNINLSGIPQGAITQAEIYGGAGDDFVVGSMAPDLIVLGDGNDIAAGGGQSDTLQGNTGNDTLMGSGSPDNLQGGDGNDDLNGQAGIDTCNGGTGTDVIQNEDFGIDARVDSNGDGVIDETENESEDEASFLVAPADGILDDEGPAYELPASEQGPLELHIRGQDLVGWSVEVVLAELTFADGTTSGIWPLGSGDPNGYIPSNIEIHSPYGPASGTITVHLLDDNGVERGNDFVAIDSVSGSFWAAIARGTVNKAIAIMETAQSVGFQIAAKKGVAAISGALGAIYNKFPAAAQQCVNAAQLVSRAFTAVGSNPQIIKITDRGLAQFFFLKDGTRFSSDGTHRAVQVGGRVYDALTGSGGMLLADYIKLLKSLNIDPILTNL